MGKMVGSVGKDVSAELRFSPLDPHARRDEPISPSFLTSPTICGTYAPQHAKTVNQLNVSLARDSE